MFRFVNIGSTCYLNTGLQLLFRAETLNRRLDAVTIEATSPETEFLKEYDNLRRLTLSSGDCTIRPERFVCACHGLARHKKHSAFSSLGQQDICEFFHFVIESLHLALVVGKENEPSVVARDILKGVYQTPVAETFFGVQSYTIRDGDTILQKTYEPFFLLDLPIPSTGNATLVQCFAAACEPETIEGYECNDGSLKTVTRTLHVEKWPTDLIVSLKRFLPDGRKNNAHVSETFFADTYKLVAVANHGGGVQGGHYVASVLYGDKWVFVDDENVYPNPMPSKGAYCFMFS